MNVMYLCFLHGHAYGHARRPETVMAVSISPGQRVLTLTSVRWSCHAFTVQRTLLMHRNVRKLSASDLQSTVATASADTGNYNGNTKYTLYPGRQGEDDAAATERLSSGLVVYLVVAGAYLTGYKHLLEDGLIRHFITRETHDSAFVCMTPVNIGHVF